MEKKGSEKLKEIVKMKDGMESSLIGKGVSVNKGVFQTTDVHSGRESFRREREMDAANYEYHRWEEMRHIERELWERMEARVFDKRYKQLRDVYVFGRW